ncbi:MAG TPA: nuclear transport factor 2 family protein [Pseudomonadales bacterium]|nr:nuclear transport factor 2 family protein [Pseudomonadales bacterium]
MALTYTLHPNASAALQKWHEMIISGNFDSLATFLHEDVCFRSPVAFTPYQGRPTVALILTQVGKVFSDFNYHRQLVADDQLSAILEFSAQVNGKQIKGIDMFKFDDEGKIIELEVMIRPLSGLMAVAEQMKARLAPYMNK